MCGSDTNRIYAYVNNFAADPLTQRGVSAINGAIVRARRNIWGVGGSGNGIAADGGSRIDEGDDCGAVSTCP